MANWVNRQEIQTWLAESLRSSNLVHISGLLGVGKTAEVRHYLKSLKSSVEVGQEPSTAGSTSQLRIRWYGFVKSLDIAVILGFEGQRLEAALMSVSEAWSSDLICVWDDVHLIRKTSRAVLMQFLKNDFSGAKHIVISEENELEILGFATPYKVLGSFDLAQTISFLPQSFSEPEKVFSKTNGNPLVLVMGLRSGHFNQNLQMWFENLSESALEVARILSLLPEGLSLAALQQLGCSKEAVDELQRRHLIQSHEQKLRMVPLVESGVQDVFDASSQKKVATQILQAIHAAGVDFKLSRLSLFRLSLIANQESLDLISWPEILPSELENLNIESLRQDLKLMEQVQLVANSKMESQILRLKLAAMIYLSDRSAALKWIAAQNLEFHESTPEHRMWFIYDCIYWMNRSGQTDLASGLSSRLVNRAKSPLKELLQIELALPFVNREPKRALDSLDRLISEIRKMPNGVQLEEIRSSANYQRATAFFTLKQYEKSLEAYMNSKADYDSLKRPYFAAFASLNIAWCYYHLQNWQLFQVELVELRRTTAKFGYKYLAIGVELLDGLNSIEQMRDTEALRLVSAAENQTRQSQMTKPWEDAALEKAKLLALMGSYQKAAAVAQDLRNHLSKADPRLGVLQLIENYEAINNEELMDLFPEPEKIQDKFLSRYFQIRGLAAAAVSARSLRDQIIEAELQLRQAASTQSLSSYLIYLEKIFTSLEEVAEPRFERVAGLCCKANLSGYQEQRQHLLEIAELELDRIPAETSDKKYLRLWIEHLRLDSLAKLQSAQEKRIAQIPKWIVYRWSSWMMASERSEENYISITNEATERHTEMPSVLDKGLSINEVSGDVYWNKKRILEFHKKPTLRQILCRLLESYPESLSKSALASAVWGESYSPVVHDSRIYTSVQRIRQLLKQDLIENWSQGYRLKNDLPFIFIRAVQNKARVENRTQSLVLQCLKKRKGWMKKSELIESVDVTDSTLKRALAALLDEGLIERQNAGPATQYKIKS